MKTSMVSVCKYSLADNAHLIQKVESTYNAAFPPVERRDFSLVVDLLSNDSRFFLDVLMDPVGYIGFITYWDYESFIYIEHFAIDEKRRNSGLGGKALHTFLQKTDKPILLEVEPPVDNEQIRRIAFYNRYGFEYHSLPYKQPPYRMGDPMLPMCLMSFGDIPFINDIQKIKTILYQNVYNWYE